MKLLRIASFVLLTPGLLLAQSNTDKNASQPNTTTEKTDVAAELKALREAMAQQQQQLALQQHEIEILKQELGAAQPGVVAASANPQVTPAPTATPAAAPQVITAAAHTSGTYDDQGKAKDSPLSFRIGGADFTPGGFMDFTTLFRSTNVGSLGTNFFAIPYSNTIQGHVSELRETAQNSRLALKVHDSFGQTDVTGYLELDFLGNDAANIFVTSNSHTLRQRLYFADVKHGKWEVAGGQMWSWLTPNRVGMSSITSEVFYTSNEDFNYQVGLTWTRAPQFRVAYHPNEHWGIGIAMENPEQFTGQAGEVTYPTLFNAQVAVQLDQANQSTIPNLMPDFIPKVAYDTTVNGKHFHAEVAGLITAVRIADLPPATSGNPTPTFEKHTATGGGVSAAVNLELFKNFRFVSNVFISDGGGRYVFGLGPDAVIRPNAAGTDVRPSLVHSFSGIAGFEWQANPQNLFSGYYGGAYFQRDAFPDTTSTASVKPIIGFGGLNSANSNNRDLQEGTLGWTRTFWKSPQHGALQFISQASYLTRSPWFVAAGAPKNAHVFMGWADLRYVLP